MPINKSNFQPKDARAFIVSYKDEEEDDDLIDGKRIMTETQALVDFLKTTSPEEFQRTAPTEKSLFSRIRKPKRVARSISSEPSSSTTASTITAPTSYTGSDTSRKKYIELVPKSPSLDTVLRNKGGEPILPNKKRESSSYSGSLRYSTSVLSQLSSNITTTRDIDAKSTTEFLEQREGMDVIESALLQRLERIRIANEQMPSDQVALGLATEHVRALGITHVLDNQNVYDKQKVRHMQVQTDDSTITTIQQPPSTLKDSEDDDVRARRAEAALENAFDHFEAISGLAYKKLRELWEEKTRWESACFELRDRILLMERNINLKELDDEDEEVGLSEFPC